jgi:DNA polymerase I-like protein with 3'-5' exonuclease and polymerase domains
VTEENEASGNDEITAIAPKFFYGDPSAPIWVVCEPAPINNDRKLPMSAASLNMFLNEAVRQGFHKDDFHFIFLCDSIPENIKKSKAKTWKHVLPHALGVQGYLEGRTGPVVTLGDLATRATVGRAVAITKARGTLLDGKVYPMLSPSFCRQVMEQAPIFKADMSTLHKLHHADYNLLQMGSFNKNYYWCTDLQFLIDQKPKLLAVDTETTGLRNTATDFRVLTTQIAYNENDVAVVAMTPKFWPDKLGKPAQLDKVRAQVKELMEDPSIRKVGHNINYDIGALGSEGIQVKGVLGDTQLMAWFVDENMQTKTLDDCARRWVPEMAGYNDQYNMELDKSNFRFLPEDQYDKFLNYAGGDSQVTFRLFWILWKEICKNDFQKHLFLKLKMPGLLAFQKMEQQGIKIDLDYLKKLEVDVAQELQELKEKLIGQVPRAVVRKHLEAKKELKFSRADFIRDILFSKDGFNLKPVVFTKTTQGTEAQLPSTSAKDHLPYFSDVDGPAGDFVTDFIEYTKLAKLYSTYVKPFAESYVHEDGKIHPQFNLHITVTGRSSSRNPNAQNFPSRGKWAKPYKKLFVASPGFKFVSADLSQIELRLIAWESGDPVMRAAYRDGKDIHKITAMAVTGHTEETWAKLSKDEQKLLRYRAKAVNFGLCLHKNSMVLTLSGLKRIVDVLETDLVWDGHEWVSHDGVVYKGKREVITYMGLTATPDHKVFISDTETVTLEYAAVNNLAIIRTGNGSQPITIKQPRSDFGERQINGKRGENTSTLQDLQRREVSFNGNSSTTTEHRLQMSWIRKVCERFNNKAIGIEIRFNGTKMYKRYASWVSQLQRKRDQMSFCFSSRICSMGEKQISRPGFYWEGFRQNKQQRTLRIFQSATSYKTRKPTKQRSNHMGRMEWSKNVYEGMVQSLFPLCRAPSLRSITRGSISETDSSSSYTNSFKPLGKMEIRVEKDRTEITGRSREDSAVYTREVVDVYDIMNAGPRHRFTADGLLVSNCYGMYWKKFRRFAKTDYGLELTDSEAQVYYETYHRLYRNVKAWHSKRTAEAGNNGFVVSLHGAKRNVPSIYHSDSFIRSQAARQAINSPIQGFGSDLGVLAIARIARQADPNIIRPVAFIHDDIILEVKDGHEELGVNTLLYTLNNPPLKELFGIQPPIPILAEADIGPNLGEMLELNELTDETWPLWLPKFEIVGKKPDFWRDERELF